MMFGRRSRERDLAILDGTQRATTPKQRQRARTKSAAKAAAKGQKWERKHWAKYTR
ncbi:hypothetical protein ACIGW3_26190 [Streptomyces sp. NPDC053499]|uniref:hypothetical protein n=1 Tax=Streptomyces sp. NPDC053499 TaxID=3365707 RepID=UPI0037CDA346